MNNSYIRFIEAYMIQMFHLKYFRCLYDKHHSEEQTELIRCVILYMHSNFFQDITGKITSHIQGRISGVCVLSANVLKQLAVLLIRHQTSEWFVPFFAHSIFREFTKYTIFWILFVNIIPSLKSCKYTIFWILFANILPSLIASIFFLYVQWWLKIERWISRWKLQNMGHATLRSKNQIAENSNSSIGIKGADGSRSKKVTEDLDFFASQKVFASS